MWKWRRSFYGSRRVVRYRRSEIGCGSAVAPATAAVSNWATCEHEHAAVVTAATAVTAAGRRRSNGDQQEDELDRVDCQMPCQAGVSSVDSVLLATPDCSCLRKQRPTIAQRCHGGARQTEELRVSGSTAHKRALCGCERAVMCAMCCATCWRQRWCGCGLAQTVIQTS